MPRYHPDLHAAADHALRQLDDDWARLVDRCGPRGAPQHPGQDPYQTLIRAVIHQQVHGRAAAAILGRLLALFPQQPFPAPEQLLATTPEQLRACGLSASKQRSVLGIADAKRAGRIPDYDSAQQMDDDRLIRQLTELWGVGRWTVEMLLIDTLGRTDILPVDDFGVREGYRRLKQLPQSPTPKQLRELGAAWAPYRTFASWYLWHAGHNLPAPAP